MTPTKGTTTNNFNNNSTNEQEQQYPSGLATVVDVANDRDDDDVIVVPYYILTGFGPFHNVPINPTSILIQNIQEHLVQKCIDDTNIKGSSSSGSIIGIPPLHERVRTIVIDTSYKAVQQRINELYQEIVVLQRVQPSRTVSSKDPQQKRYKYKYILLHFGLHGMNMTYHMESCAYNEMNFTIPDIYNDQPSLGTSIIPSSLLSTVPFTATKEVEDRQQLLSGHSNDPVPSQLTTTLLPQLHDIVHQFNQSSNSSTNMTNNSGSSTEQPQHQQSNDITRQNYVRPYGNTYIPVEKGTDIATNTNITSIRNQNDGAQRKRYLLVAIGNNIKNAKYGINVSISTNPGRYVSNYIYYYSMYKFQSYVLTHAISGINNSKNKSQNNDNNISISQTNSTTAASSTTNATTATCTTNSPNVQCLFIHVPTFFIAPYEKQLAFITDLLYYFDEKNITSV